MKLKEENINCNTPCVCAGLIKKSYYETGR